VARAREAKKRAGYKELIIWQRSMHVASKILLLTSLFPKQHQFGIAQQMQRSAVSIPSNIAEGFNRASRKEYVYFLSVALGSTGELETQCSLSVMAKLCTEQDVVFLVSELDEIGKMLRGMIRTLSPPSPSPRS
jgi:four helix bundle protein